MSPRPGLDTFVPDSPRLTRWVALLPLLRGFPAGQEAELGPAREPGATKACHPIGTGVETPEMSRFSLLTLGQRVAANKYRWTAA